VQGFQKTGTWVVLGAISPLGCYASPVVFKINENRIE
jgi:hypothetical protein